MNHARIAKNSVVFAVLVSTFFLSEPLARAASVRDCQKLMIDLGYRRLSEPEKPLILFADGTETPIAFAFEKEGLFYSDIAPWFDRIDRAGAYREAVRNLTRETEATSGPRPLHRWLARYPRKYRAANQIVSRNHWQTLTPREQLDWIFRLENPFDAINENGREELFLEGLLSFDHLRPSASTPGFLRVSDDLGSYEVKTRGTADRHEHLRERQFVEDHLESRVGHQHLVHGWPKDAARRAEIAPRYIELLDATTWFLFWRQVARDPGEYDSVLSHPFLGVYTRPALTKLHQAVVDGDARRFDNKFRMVGARNLPASAEIQGPHVEGRLPDFEMRSGNKGAKRDFVEEMLIARFVTGNYADLRDYRDSAFDPAAPLTELMGRWLDADSMSLMLRFEKEFSLLKRGTYPGAQNHFRSKILAPLFPWQNRLEIEHKAVELAAAQKAYALGLVQVAKRFFHRQPRLAALTGLEHSEARTELRERTMEEIEPLAFRFASAVRLQEDFERYLKPECIQQCPPVLVKPTGPLDVNKIDLGIEYSFRFPLPVPNVEYADRELRLSAEAFAREMRGGKVEKIETGGHGHGLSLRYLVTDVAGRQWRVEWDGIRRTYENGQPVNPFGGHIEIPTPKYAMRDAGDIMNLYRAMQALGRDPKRGAGGAHVNVDLAPLFAMPEKVGARKLANLIAFFESNREMVGFLWQHPFRTRVAAPVAWGVTFLEKLDAFDGGWNDLGRMLYEQRYFNPFISRKPNYSQLNATAVMDPAVPEAYKHPIDIKNPEVQWFPAFGGKGKDRVEFRLFDAPTDWYRAALQVKYVRALLDRALNAEGTVKLAPRHPADAEARWKKDSKQFLVDAEEHLRELGLDPVEFRPLLVESWRVQQIEPTKKTPLVEYEEFGPAVKPK